MAPIGSLLGNEDGKYVINKSDKGGLCVLFNSWFRIGIALAGMLAVVMIVLGGFQYATTDAMTSKSEGKSKIQNALWGLMLALTTWLVLNTVNPDLVNCTINASEVQLSALQMSVSGALGSDLFGIGMLGTNNALQAVNSNGGGVSQAQIDAEYNNAYSQWTDADDELLRSDPDNAGALAKWEGIQMQIEGLDMKYANQNISGSSNSSSRDIAKNVSDNGWRIYQEVQSSLNSSQCTISDIRNGCANSVGNVLKKAGYNIAAGDSTIGVQNTLSKSPDWVLVPGGLNDSLPGDVVVSPTGKEPGHTGIVTGVGGSTIAANRSATGLFKDDYYTKEKWINDLEGSRHLKTYVYRRK